MRSILIETYPLNAIATFFHRDNSTICFTVFLENSIRVVLCYWTTLLKTYLTNKPKIIRESLAEGRLMVELCSFHFRKIALRVLMGTVRTWEIRWQPIFSRRSCNSSLPLLSYSANCVAVGDEYYFLYQSTFFKIWESIYKLKHNIIMRWIISRNIFV